MSIHTMSMTSNVFSSRSFHHILNTAYQQISRNRYELVYKSDSSRVLFSRRHPGVIVTLHTCDTPFLSLKINPSRLTGSHYASLFDATPELIGKVSYQIDLILFELGTNITFEDLSLSRIDCTKDILFPDQESISEFLLCVQHTMPKRDYEICRFGKEYENHNELNRHSFRTLCSNICLTIYDKSYQLEAEHLMLPCEIPQGTLRFEAAIQRPAFHRLLQTHISSTRLNHDNKSLILTFSQLSGKLLHQCFSSALTNGQYLQRDLAFCAIDQSNLKPKLKARMKEIIIAVSTCYKSGITGARKQLLEKGMSARQFNYAMEHFRLLGINPATIRRDSRYDRFPSVESLLKEDKTLAA